MAINYCSFLLYHSIIKSKIVLCLLPSTYLKYILRKLKKRIYFVTVASKKIVDVFPQLMSRGLDPSSMPVSSRSSTRQGCSREKIILKNISFIFYDTFGTFNAFFGALGNLSNELVLFGSFDTFW